MLKSVCNKDKRKQSSRLGLFLCAALLLGGCATTPLSPAPENEIGTEQLAAQLALDNGELGSALVHIRNAEELDPDNVRTLELLARFYLVSDDKEGQRATAEQLLALQAEHSGALLRLGLLELEAGRMEAAREYLQRAIRQDASLWLAWNGLGVIADSESRFSEAEQFYRRGLDLVPGHPQLSANLGWSKLLAGDYEAAESWLRDSLASDPDSTLVQSNLAFSVALQGRYEEALMLYDEIYDEAVAANNVGYAAIVRGDNENAENYLRRALELNPRYYERAANNLRLISP